MESVKRVGGTGVERERDVVEREDGNGENCGLKGVSGFWVWGWGLLGFYFVGEVVGKREEIERERGREMGIEEEKQGTQGSGIRRREEETEEA